MHNGNWAQQHILHNLQLPIITQYKWNHREGITNEELDSLPNMHRSKHSKAFNTHEKLFLLAEVTSHTGSSLQQKESRSCLEPLAAQISCCRRQTVISSSTSEDKHLASQTASACLKEWKRVVHWHGLDAFKRAHTHTQPTHAYKYTQSYTNDTQCAGTDAAVTNQRGFSIIKLSDMSAACVCSLNAATSLSDVFLTTCTASCY